MSRIEIAGESFVVLDFKPITEKDCRGSYRVLGGDDLDGLDDEVNPRPVCPVCHRKQGITVDGIVYKHPAAK